MRWILLLLLLPLPLHAEVPAPPGVEPFALPNSSIQVLHAMLPVEQLGLLPDGAAIRRISVRNGDVTVVVARPHGADLAFRLMPRVGPAADGEPRRIAVIAEPTLEVGAEAIRLALVQLIRDKEGGFQWVAESTLPTPAVRAQAPAPAAQTSAPPPPPASAVGEAGPTARVVLALFLVAFIAWAVLWKRRADARGEGS